MDPTLIESRFSAGLELRAAPEGSGFIGTLRGVSAPYESDSVLLREHGRAFVERVSPTAFSGTLADGHEIVSLFCHDFNAPLGRRGDNLTIRSTKVGLESELHLRDTTVSRDVLKQVRSGEVKGQSFAFVPVEERWFSRGAQVVRVLEKVDLIELGPCKNPAYKASSVSARSLDRFLELRSSRPDACATVLRGDFRPGAITLPPAEFREGEMCTVAAFRERFPGLPFVAEIASELRGFHDYAGQFVCDGAELREACRDPEAVGRALERLADRGDEKIAAATSLIAATNRRQW